MSSLACTDPRRRELLQRNRRLNGLDYLDVSADQRVLRVHLIDKTPVSVSADQLRIEGGQKVRDIQVTGVSLNQSDRLETDDFLEVTVDKPGDFSTYTLRVVTGGEDDPNAPHPAFDPYYSALDFSFKVGCPGDLDCAPARRCPEPAREEPNLNYLAKDYASFRQLLLDRLALVMPDWKERHVPDVGIALVEILAYVGDHLSYYQDAVATEAYLETARLRTSVRRHARLVDYPMHEGCNGRAWVCIETDTVLQIAPDTLFFATRLESGDRTFEPALSREELQDGGIRYLQFEPVFDRQIRLYPNHNKIAFYTWGQQECCLDAGATEATLYGELVEACPTQSKPSENNESADGDSPAPPPRLRLAPGDVLIFEEVIGPGTGSEHDADPERRHAVRLTGVEAGFDPLTRAPVVHIRWAACDALPFPLCLSALGPPPECNLLENVSVARGNAVLVDHGATQCSDLDPVPEGEEEACCLGEGMPGDAVRKPGTYRPDLAGSPLTFSAPVTESWCATDIGKQDPRQAVPRVTLDETTVRGRSHRWRPVRDLLHARWDERSFVAELDDEGTAELRFGDGRSGMRPAAGSAFRACYRIGNGRAGNVGAEAIAHLVLRQGKLDGGISRVRNPLPASGGMNPESVAEVKLFAPRAFAKKLQRAITAEDYAHLVERDFAGEVQRAAAVIDHRRCDDRVIVAVDPLGREVAPAELLNAVEGHLQRYRRIGHDLSVRPACLVPLDLELQVCVKPGYLRAHVKAALLEAFSNRLLADGSQGFFHPDRLSFGEAVYVSRLAATAQSVSGVESVAVTRLQRRFEPANRELENGLLPLGPLEIPRLENDPDFPEHGRLELVMGGGR
jgi:hypothetical protein